MIMMIQSICFRYVFPEMVFPEMILVCDVSYLFVSDLCQRIICMFNLR